jgi:hypothetical protein
MRAPEADSVDQADLSKSWQTFRGTRPVAGGNLDAVMVEIPDRVISELENPGPPELRLKALGTAMNATWHQRVKYGNFQFSSWSSSVVVDANPADYGAASFRAGVGCTAWIVESPLAAKHLDLTVR